MLLGNIYVNFLNCNRTACCVVLADCEKMHVWLRLKGRINPVLWHPSNSLYYYSTRNELIWSKSDLRIYFLRRTSAKFRKWPGTSSILPCLHGNIFTYVNTLNCGVFLRSYASLYTWFFLICAFPCLCSWSNWIPNGLIHYQSTKWSDKVRD